MNGQNQALTTPACGGSPLAESPENGSVAFSHLVYRGIGTVIIAGARFRRVYVFSAQEPEQLVETEDVAALLGTGLFRTER